MNDMYVGKLPKALNTSCTVTMDLVVTFVRNVKNNIFHPIFPLMTWDWVHNSCVILFRLTPKISSKVIIHNLGYCVINLIILHRWLGTYWSFSNEENAETHSAWALFTFVQKIWRRQSTSNGCLLLCSKMWSHQHKNHSFGPASKKSHASLKIHEILCSERFTRWLLGMPDREGTCSQELLT